MFTLQIRFYLTLIFSIVFLSTCSGATQTVEEIITNIESKKDYNIQIESFKEKAEYYQGLDLKISLSLAQKGLALAKTNNDTQNILRCRLLIAHSNFMLGMHQKSLVTLEEIEKKAIKEEYIDLLVDLYEIRIQLFMTASLVEKAKQEVAKLYAAAEKYNKPQSKVEADISLAIIARHEENYGLSKSLCLLIRNSKSARTKQKMQALSVLGEIYQMTSKLDSALYCFNTNYEELKGGDDQQGFSITAFFLGNTYFLKKEYDQALKFYHEANEVAHHLNWSEIRTSILSSLAEAYMKKNNFKAALDYQSQAFNLARQSYQKNIAITAQEFSVAYSEKERGNISLGNSLSKSKEINSQLEKDLLIWRIVIIGVVLLLILFGIGVFQYRRRVKAKLESFELSERLARKQTEYKSVLKQASDVYDESKDALNLTNLLVQDNPKSDFLKELQGKLKGIHSSLMREKNWEGFIESFRNRYPNFESTVTAKFSNLSNNDLRLSIYMKAGLNVKEISELKDISSEGVKSAMRRLKKKINVPKNISLEKYIDSF